jgi:chromate reductase
MKLTGISGSIREKSYNTMLLHAAAERLPEGVTMSVIDCGDIPLYNGDLDGEVKPPAVA